MPQSQLPWRQRRDIVLLASLLVAFALLWAVHVVVELAMGQRGFYDVWLLRALRHADNPADALGPGWVEEAARDVTSLGGPIIVALVTVSVFGYLLLSRRVRLAALVLTAVLGGWGLNELMKVAFNRPRPEVVPHLVEVSSYSFPSGHSMLSAILYTTLAALLARVQPTRRLRLYVLAVGVVLMVLVGCSRVYLGVHYPSDVLGGWCIGVGWSLAVAVVAAKLQARGEVEPARDGA